MSQRILVIDDHEDNRHILRDLLEHASYEVIEAMTGEEGVALAAAHVPDLILMDIQLPDIDGYEATRRIKAMPALRHIPLIAVTSYALSGDDAKALSAGCDAYVTKPFSPRALLARSRSTWSGRRPSASVKTPPLILVADDNPMNVDILQTRLSAHGYEILTAADGQEALETARNSRPDLILVDIMMPKMDGIEVCQRLKEDPALPFTPIIMVTARAESKDVVAALEAGGGTST